ncbi:MAG: DUF5908 family protein [Rhodothermia bacterium]
MPIVINELVFKGEIAPARTPQQQARPQQRPVNKKELVEACVDEVMRLLEKQKER